MRNDQNIRKQDRCIEGEPSNWLQCHLRRQFRREAKIEEVRGFLTDSPIFRQVSTCLAHQPDGRDRLAFALQCAHDWLDHRTVPMRFLPLQNRVLESVVVLEQLIGLIDWPSHFIHGLPTYPHRWLKIGCVARTTMKTVVPRKFWLGSQGHVHISTVLGLVIVIEGGKGRMWTIGAVIPVSRLRDGKSRGLLPRDQQLLKPTLMDLWRKRQGTFIFT